MQSLHLRHCVSNLRAFKVETEDPEFTDVIDNITVPAGRNIKLACSVKNLGSYKVPTSQHLYVHLHIYVRVHKVTSVQSEKFCNPLATHLERSSHANFGFE
uniref:Uncharacterized protein n=1 Tax=Glossina palpalis gambiensis TaxID=67801 RepID=A0A1B0C1X9_9MUSC